MTTKKARRGRGEGSVEELPSGKFRAVLSLGIDTATKKRVKLAKTFDTKGEALKWWREKKREHDGGTLTTTATTLGDWLTAWLAIRKADKSPNTHRTEKDTAERRLRPGLGHVELRQLTPLLVERWLARLTDETTHNERRKAAKLLKLVLNDAVKRRVIGANPMAGIPIPARIETEAAALSRDQLGKMLAAAEALGHGLLFTVWADTGLRPGELYGLQWSDFDAAKGLSVRRAVCTTTGKLKTPKTKRSRRTLVLAPDTTQRLAAAATDRSGPMFPTPVSRGHWTNTNFTKQVFDKVSKVAGLLAVASPYTLRHTMATLLLQAGVSIKVVSERLGHEDVVTTLKSYAHVLPGMQEQAARVMEGILAEC
ncbi:integrase family protein : Integrase family protein OS=Thermoanaerobacterium saccharolyticum (strain DSM 8691 / JW/SL-YS485) GN=Tsac_1962 PE=4 SV=1: Phage_int_SAM_3: Phage_integrase [Gemmataceae bacterium]|nr:integrase family protein : Integrase family protein OS=Thermoanaerobacterium saccharolyticum (strain DSM 8691 / JW/SL-YS485) GN=Tsac_1962 PE=4 SV=1: Phage_int_SAM_3: Phage_integrase [Gemmataceae bacterium]VTT97576.1 integrase family protein : Integrase family protein OS=Thermoanaerobacterium saccharolyticum (strain DSM 8691 / JW/SL-YS485) GN=Tsac_1962 PE=4 SV=1: Phage_int_SAM_3: Phage_integrase [Gemmataceae bacterium]